MKGKKAKKTSKLPHKPSKPKLSTADAIARTLAPKQPKEVKVLEESAIIPETTPEIVNDSFNLKDQLTLMELDFLEIYLSGGKTIENAMIQAGYGDMERGARWNLAKRIIIKYESGASDKRNIFRAIGLGESKVAKNIKELTESAKSEMVKLNANALAAKCLRLTDEPQASHQGVNIIINCGTEPAGGPGAPARPVNVLVQGSDLPAKPLQITK